MIWWSRCTTNVTFPDIVKTTVGAPSGLQSGLLELQALDWLYLFLPVWCPVGILQVQSDNNLCTGSLGSLVQSTRCVQWNHQRSCQRVWHMVPGSETGWLCPEWVGSVRFSPALDVPEALRLVHRFSIGRAPANTQIFMEAKISYARAPAFQPYHWLPDLDQWWVIFYNRVFPNFLNSMNHRGL